MTDEDFGSADKRDHPAEANEELANEMQKLYERFVSKYGYSEANKRWISPIRQQNRGRPKGRFQYNPKDLQLMLTVILMDPPKPRNYRLTTLAKFYFEQKGRDAGLSLTAVQQRMRRRLVELQTENENFRRRNAAELQRRRDIIANIPKEQAAQDRLWLLVLEYGGLT